MSWQFGIHITIIAIVLVTLIIHLYRRSPIQRMLFNSTQHALSLILAQWFSNKCMSLLINKIDMSVLYENLISLLLFCVFFVFQQPLLRFVNDTPSTTIFNLSVV